jgi:predicted nuclease of predicted toxin-antitoxin system
MKLCANENVPGDCVAVLRESGHDVLWIREGARGSTDALVLALAQSEERLLITFDKDFGELVYRQGAVASDGVVLFRLRKPSPDLIAKRVKQILESRTDWPGHFSVVDEHSVRMRRLR